MHSHARLSAWPGSRAGRGIVRRRARRRQQHPDVAELTAIQDEITAAQTSPALRTPAPLTAKDQFEAIASPTISQWWVDEASNTVGLGFTKLTPEVEAAARAAYGNAVSFKEIPRGEQGSRFNDTTPFYGGDRLSMANSNTCTSGFAITISGTTRMLIAGHCDTTGAVWIGSTSTVMGTVVSGTNTNGGWDTAIVSGSYLGTVWDGSVNTTTTHSVQGSWRPNVGTGSICMDGSVTGKNCTGVVEVANGGICHKWSDTLITTCHLAQLNSQNATRLMNHGDSGGPVYRIGVNSSNDLQAVGICEGMTSDGTTAWYTPIPDLLSHWGASIIL